MPMLRLRLVQAGCLLDLNRIAALAAVREATVPLISLICTSRVR
jgi:hypothetical protein